MLERAITLPKRGRGRPTADALARYERELEMFCRRLIEIDSDDPDHNDHDKQYVRDYIAKFGVRKCEANALVTRAEAGRALCRSAILKYVPADAPHRYDEQLRTEREAVRREIARLMRRWGRAK